jgi:hypothetical protein
MKKLRKASQSLYKTVVAARELAESHAGANVGPLQVQANLFLLKMVTQAVGVLRSIPVSPLGDAKLPLWDLSTAASSTRSILESYLVFYHLFAEKVSGKERQFRFAVWLRHGLAEKEKFRKVSGIRSPANWARSVSEAKAPAEKSPFFGSRPNPTEKGPRREPIDCA